MTGHNVRLRALEKEDLLKLYLWENDMDLWAGGNTAAPISKYTLALFIQESGKDIYETKQLRLMIQNRDNKVVGAVDLFDFDPVHARAGVGIFIDRDFRSRGYANEAITLIKRYASEVLFLHQLYCTIDVNNQASIHLFKETGFVETGCQKSWLRGRDHW